MTPITAATSTRTNWPDHEFEALRTWYPSVACGYADHAVYGPIFKVCIKFRGL